MNRQRGGKMFVINLVNCQNNYRAGAAALGCYGQNSFNCWSMDPSSGTANTANGDRDSPVLLLTNARSVCHVGKRGDTGDL